MTSFQYTLLGSLLLFAIVEGHSKSLERITYGQEAKEGQFPYIVNLEMEKKDRLIYNCGGSIIAHDWTLTAAHCLDGVQRLTIHYGSINESSQFKVNVETNSHIFQHPNYRRIPVVNDIALIHSDWVDFNDRIQSIALPSPNLRGQTFVGQWARAAGWGRFLDSSVDTSVTLKWVDLQIIENFICANAYPNVLDNVLCVATPNRQSTCPGDSGGPLVLINKNILVGVTSFIGSSCESGEPAGFSRVSEHLDWIREISGVTS